MSILSGLSSEERKRYAIYRGFFKIFPDACAMVARHTVESFQKHCPGEEDPRWDMDKSKDELDALLRHMTDEQWLHLAWRGMSNLQRKYNEGWRPDWSEYANP